MKLQKFFPLREQAIWKLLVNMYLIVTFCYRSTILCPGDLMRTIATNT